MDSNFYFEPFTSKKLLELTSTRDGEEKLGQKLSASFEKQNVHFVIIGIEESVGPIANHGNPGAENAFYTFLKCFVNMQANDFFDGANTAIQGSIIQNCEVESVVHARELTKELDLLVEKTIRPILLKGKIPIVIGGGHNNAFPLIAANYNLYNEEIAILNLDPHADCRKREGRHSGNPFSYAFANGYLDTYTVLGLHKAYNSAFLLEFLRENRFKHTFFDDYLENPDSFYQDISIYFEAFLNYKHVGVELDLDAIQNMPSSAFSPSGITLEEARHYIKTMAKIPNLRYLHLPEGAPTNEHEEKIVGKALAYLVWDFLESRTKFLP
jgi:formiminoglutamase